jgi:hypothetical protein
VATKKTITSSTVAPSSISTTRSLLPPTPPFLPTSSLQIQTAGKALFRLPSPLKELTIPIFSTETGRPIYLSVREKRSSGNCRLIDAESEDEHVLASTIYHWGPGKNPIVRIGEGESAEEFEIISKSMLSRSVVFSCRWGTFEWRYAGRKEKDEGVNTLLVLERVDNEEGRQRVRVAQLIRGEETRSPGSTSSSAGNGGRLEMCLDDGEGKLVDELTVVSTCLVMLKKEVDRRRAMQVVMISAAITGGVH